MIQNVTSKKVQLACEILFEVKLDDISRGKVLERLTKLYLTEEKSQDDRTKISLWLSLYLDSFGTDDFQACSST